MASLFSANAKLALLGSIILVSGCSIMPGAGNKNAAPTPPTLGKNADTPPIARRQKLRFGYEVANARQKFLAARKSNEDTTLDTSIASTTTAGDPAQFAANQGAPVYPQTTPNIINYPAQIPSTGLSNQIGTPVLPDPQTLPGQAPYAPPSPFSTVQRLPDVQHATYEK
jgi:hypothetical protein